MQVQLHLFQTKKRKLLNCLRNLLGEDKWVLLKKEPNLVENPRKNFSLGFAKISKKFLRWMKIFPDSVKEKF
jgi:hypothetical protein